MASPFAPPGSPLPRPLDVANLPELPPLPHPPTRPFPPAQADESASPTTPGSLSNSSTGSSSPVTSPRSSGKSGRSRSFLSASHLGEKLNFIRISGSGTAKDRHGPDTHRSDSVAEEFLSSRRRDSVGRASPRMLSPVALATSTHTTTTTTTTTTSLFPNTTTTTTTTAVGNDADSSNGSEHEQMTIGEFFASSPSRRPSASSSTTASPTRTPFNSFSNTPELGRKRASPEMPLKPRAIENRKLFDELREWALQRDELLAAVGSFDAQKVYAACLAMTTDAAWSDQLPIPDPKRLDGKMTAVAKAYAQSDHNEQHHKLLAYAQWCDAHHQRMLACEKDMAEVPPSSSDFHPAVGDLCLAMRQLDEAADEHALSVKVKHIHKMIRADGEHITARELARQPYASTQMMLQKMPLLAAFRAGEALDRFRTQLKEAHQIRKDSVKDLRDAMHKVRPKWSRAIPVSAATLVALSVNAYAHGMTIPADDLVPDTVPKDRLDVMHMAISGLAEDAKDLCTGLEMLALRYVRKCISERVELIKQRLPESTDKASNTSS